MADITKALREATGSAGGYLVPEEFAARVYDLIQAKTVVLPDLETVNMNTDVMYIPKTTAGTTAYWVAETNSITESDMQFGRITLNAEKVASLVKASSEVLEDNNVAVANLMVEQMAKDIALSIDNQVFNGTGSPWNGLRSTASYTNSYSAGGGTSAGNIGLTAISKAIDEVLADNHDQPNVAYFNPRTIGNLRVLTDGSARPIFNAETWGSPLLREGVIGTVYGMGIKPTTQLPINLSYGTAAGETTCADAIVGVSKMFGIFGNRRQLVWKTDYEIVYDIYDYQTTMRCAFATKYPNAYCVIKAIKD